MPTGSTSQKPGTYTNEHRTTDFFFFFPSEKIIVPGQDGCKEGTLSTAGLVIAIVIVESHRVDIPEAGGTPEPVDLYLSHVESGH